MCAPIGSHKNVLGIYFKRRILGIYFKRRINLNIQSNTPGKKLLFWGAMLFLIGLLQGVLIPYFLNSRMALSAHLAAVQSGMALMIFGLLWNSLELPEKWLKVTYYSSVASMYAIWLAITLAAIFGSSKALPIAGAGFSSSFVTEVTVEIIVTLGAGLCVVSSVLIVLGLYRGLKSAV